MKKFVFALSLLALGATPALSATVDFATVDANADGQVTMDEAKAAGLDWTEAQFAAADTDASGGLSQEEYEAVAS